MQEIGSRKTEYDQYSCCQKKSNPQSLSLPWYACTMNEVDVFHRCKRKSSWERHFPADYMQSSPPQKLENCVAPLSASSSCKGSGLSSIRRCSSSAGEACESGVEISFASIIVDGNSGYMLSTYDWRLAVQMGNDASGDNGNFRESSADALLSLFSTECTLQ